MYDHATGMCAHKHSNPADLSPGHYVDDGLPQTVVMEIPLHGTPVRWDGWIRLVSRHPVTTKPGLTG